MLRVVVVDLGASSIRVGVVDLDAVSPAVEIVHRYPHAPVRARDGSLRWDWRRIEREILVGLERALEGGPVASIGVDAWGVDYGLLDAAGELLSPPYSYRDDRTANWRTTVQRLGAKRLYRLTGLQLMAINTIFQLAVHDRRELAAARRLLTIPELVVHTLTGRVSAERTSAGTTALMDIREGTWSRELLEELELDPDLFPRIETAPALAGHWRGIPVHLVAGHDTASALAALSESSEETVFVSSGTWMLVGIERREVDTSEAALRSNFSNEPGPEGRICFLKNVMGLWMLERLLDEWSLSRSVVLEAAASLPAGGPTVDATDERFLAPESMDAEIRAAADLGPSAGRDRVARCVLDSLALAVATVVQELRTIVGPPAQIEVVGGGSRNALLNHIIEEATGLPVRVGSAEATALGNALLQGIALGRFAGLDDARASLAAPDPS